MLLAFLAFLGGVLTILSPCVLPVLPFAFARSDQPFARSTLPLLLGMALTFAAIATLAAVGGGWAVQFNSIGRTVALIVLALLGLTLLSRRASDFLTRPFVAFGNRIVQAAGNSATPVMLQSALLGVAMGFLWAPCAGPILGLILTGAALSGPSTQTTILLFAYALGAVVSLAVAVLIGGRVFAALKQSLGAGEWVRRGLGVAVLVAVVAIALGWDTGILTRLSSGNTNRIEQALLDALPASAADGKTPLSTTTAAGNADVELPVLGWFPPLDGADAWLNSPPLTTQSLRGKVVLIDFWTYSCINCLRAMPYVKAWHERYKDHGLVVIGVHTPEFAFEKDEGNVRRATQDLGVSYPVALDNDYAIWRAFKNRYWPAHYFIDANGLIRGQHFGEGEYDESEQLIRRLLTDAGQQNLPPSASEIRAEGVQSAADVENVASPETYVGYRRAENFASPDGLAGDRSEALRRAGRIAAQSVGTRGPVDREPAGRRARCAGRQDRVPIPRARPAPRARLGERGQARALPGDARRRESGSRIAAWTSMPMARASSRASACISSSASRAPCAIARSPSNSWMPARRRLHSPSDDLRTLT